jgi:hypothetical protein
MTDDRTATKLSSLAQKATCGFEVGDGSFGIPIALPPYNRITHARQRQRSCLDMPGNKCHRCRSLLSRVPQAWVVRSGDPCFGTCREEAPLARQDESTARSPSAGGDTTQHRRHRHVGIESEVWSNNRFARVGHNNHTSGDSRQSGASWDLRSIRSDGPPQGSLVAH